MGNMAYCRFQNTLSDLSQCDEHLDDDLSAEEDAARTKLIKLCIQIAREFDDGESEDGP